MEAIIKLYSSYENEINRFLDCFFAQKWISDTSKNIQYNENSNNKNFSLLEWQKKYQNPLEMVDMIGTFIENNNKFKINMWISLDKDIFINVTDSNADNLIRYMYERYPW